MEKRTRRAINVIADREGIIVVYPIALDDLWNSAPPGDPWEDDVWISRHAHRGRVEGVRQPPRRQARTGSLLSRLLFLSSLPLAIGLALGNSKLLCDLLQRRLFIERFRGHEFPHPLNKVSLHWLDR